MRFSIGMGLQKTDFPGKCSTWCPSGTHPTAPKRGDGASQWIPIKDQRTLSVTNPFTTGQRAGNQ